MITNGKFSKLKYGISQTNKSYFDDFYTSSIISPSLLNSNKTVLVPEVAIILLSGSTFISLGLNPIHYSSHTESLTYHLESTRIINILPCYVTSIIFFCSHWIPHVISNFSFLNCSGNVNLITTS